MQLTALLPMKGNSERIPNKNIRPFAGKPLFCHIMETLTSCPCISEVLLNTDSPRIAEMGRRFSKVRIIDRPQSLCGDMVPMNDIIAHDLQFAETEHILQTHSTNPLLTLTSLEKCIEMYAAGLQTHDSLFSVTKWQTRFYWPDGTPVNHNPLELLRTQDLPALYEENSCIYLFSQKSFQEAGGRRIGKRPAMFPLSSLESVDIDVEEDFALAEILAIRKNNAQQHGKKDIPHQLDMENLLPVHS